MMNHNHEKKYVFEPLHHVEFLVGNQCDITVFKKEGETAYLEVSGDSSFMEFLALENNNGVLHISVKNPTGSDTTWIPYDRGNVQKRNTITLHTGTTECILYVVNYLDLNVYESELDDHTDRWLFLNGNNAQ